MFLVDCFLKRHTCMCTHSERGEGEARLLELEAARKKGTGKERRALSGPVLFYMDLNFYRA